MEQGYREGREDSLVSVAAAQNVRQKYLRTDHLLLSSLFPLRSTSGNEEGKQGFGHIAISVPNLKDSVAYFDKHNVQFKKRPEDGKMRNIAFIFDPDGYWIEVIAMDNKDV